MGAGAWTARAVPLGPVAATGFARLPEQLHVFVWRLAQNRAYILHVFYTTGGHAALPDFFASAIFSRTSLRSHPVQRLLFCRKQKITV